jgi:cysteine desulfurase / selenocysteine lyase
VNTPPVYLDYAATSALRPPEVVAAVTAYLTDIGATPGRSGHTRAVDAGRIALRSRRALARFFNIPGDPGRIAFQLNATHALNTALHGTLKPGDRLVRTEFDHNAVRRPAAALAAGGVEVAVLPGRPDGSVDPDEARALIRGSKRSAQLVALPHVSNVLGHRLPLRQLSDLAHAEGALVLVDAAQSAGHIRVDVQALGIDILAFTGHKGLLGPQGVGGLWVREGLDVGPLLRGGTGGDSLPEEMPETYPDHLEAGTLNGPGIAGLLAGIEWLEARGMASLHRQESELKGRLHAALDAMAGIVVQSPPDPDGAGIVTFTSGSLPAEELAGRLEREHGIQCRSGLHCAPEAHRVLGTLATGAVRFSLGWASTAADVDRALEAVAQLHDINSYA